METSSLKQHFYSLRLRFRFVKFFSAVLNKNNSADNNSENHHSDKKYSESSHFSALPPSTTNPIKMNNTTAPSPRTNIHTLNFSAATICANTNPANVYLARSYKTIAKLFRCFLFSFTGSILQQIKMFVNPAPSGVIASDNEAISFLRRSRVNPVKIFIYGVHQSTMSLRYRVTGSLLLFCVLCGFSAFSAFAQEIDVKTKIKEWFGIPFGPSSGRGFTIPSEVEGLKHKDPAVRILAIQTSKKVEMVQFIHHGEQCRTKEG